jgi:hypothetical protein
MEPKNKGIFSPISRWGDYILATRQEDGTYKPITFSDGSLVIYGSRKDAEQDKLPDEVIITVSIPDERQ